jgi:hypothetical protein
VTAEQNDNLLNIRRCVEHGDCYTRWFKYDRDNLCVNKSQFVPVIFEPPCILCYELLCPLLQEIVVKLQMW